VTCHDLEPVIEAIADGSHQPDAEEAAHLAACPACAARLEHARAIESLLALRDTPSPSASFTAAVMTRVGEERWQTERFVDLGFNLAIAAGVLVILVGGAGLAWSLGLLTITIDLDAVLRALDTNDATGRFLSQVQTFVIAAVVLTMALGLWWWAEAGGDEGLTD
jgi:anti-sigma factor RsiW